jgi:hypothetical protein
MSEQPHVRSVHTEGGSHGAVADTIHGGVHNNYFQVPADASPEEKFEAAVQFLDSGQATTARRYLDEAIVEFPGSGRVGFFWLLAFFSRRTYPELTPEERERAARELKRISELPMNRWSAAIEVIRRLFLARYSASDTAPAATGVMADLDRLSPAKRDAIFRHMERMLQGSVKDEVWDRDVEQARGSQMAGDREQRVWKFFEAEPRAPRTRPVCEPDVSAVLLALARVTAVVVLVTSAVLGWLTVQRDDNTAIVALVVALSAAGLGLRFGSDWQFHVTRQRSHDQESRTIRSSRQAARPRGFATEVSRSYLRYVKRYAPADDRERESWINESYRPLCRMRNDLVEAYRDQKSTVEEIRWLIRFQVRDLQRRWAADEPLHRRPVVPGHLPLLTGVSWLVALVSLLWVAQSAMRQELLLGAGVTAGLLVSGVLGARIGMRILAEGRRFDAETLDRETRMTAYSAEYRRWRKRLSDRPTDMEMARWLDCDRRLMLDAAIRTYQLKWSDVKAYASLEARGSRSRRARVKNGPWRYTRYELLVFLLTADGVRQLDTQLTFAKAAFRNWDRTNYRYDAVAAVRVVDGDDEARMFQLLLVNGTDINVDVAESGRPDADEDGEILADAAKDATGLRHALFVLEGVAAEGRSWWDGPSYGVWE